MSVGFGVCLATARRGKRRKGVAVALLLVLCLLCPILHAQSAPAQAGEGDSLESTASGQEDAERAERAERLFQRGTEAYEARHYERAYRDLRDAFRFYPSFRTACGLGQIELHLERFRDAAEHLEFCISRFPSQGDEAVRVSILNGLAEARRHVAVFVPQVNESGATVLINAEPVGVTPLAHDVYVEPGRRRVTVKKPGFTDVAVELFFPAGGKRQVQIALQPQHTAMTAVADVEDGSGPLLLVGSALTAATVGFGATLLWTATGLEAEASKSRTDAHTHGCRPASPSDPCLQARHAIDRATARRELATSVLLSGAGLGVLTGLSYVLWRSLTAGDLSEQELPVAVAVSPSTATLTLGGSF